MVCCSLFLYAAVYDGSTTVDHLQEAFADVYGATVIVYAKKFAAYYDKTAGWFLFSIAAQRLNKASGGISSKALTITYAFYVAAFTHALSIIENVFGKNSKVASAVSSRAPSPARNDTPVQKKQ
ncbi:hypothetical protein ROZALSC1DRAFT_31514 [Rozella allomycis CSF55]|uniref:Uncharacterized protein n=1 Tax=Rozella allomycis (strain CSF55) TaxID=988480 RepID=A0A4P9YEA9_ROZAC|nr:hypothetical protein ROZALSC1DRAFT_31514 [Rozella allomycis CSF55]